MIPNAPGVGASQQEKMMDETTGPKVFLAAARAYGLLHAATAEAAHAKMVALGIHNQNGTLTEIYANGD